MGEGEGEEEAAVAVMVVAVGHERLTWYLRANTRARFLFQWQHRNLIEIVPDCLLHNLCTKTTAFTTMSIVQMGALGAHQPEGGKTSGRG